VPNAAAKTAYNHQQATHYDDRRFTTPAGLAVHCAEVACLLSALRRLPPAARVLEVGCGTGRLLMEARAEGYRVDGVDASPDMLDMLRAKLGGIAGPPPDLRVGEAARLPHKSDSYDFVYSIRVLNQTTSREYALDVVTEMLRVAKPGGCVLVEFVNEYRPRWGSARTPTVRLRPHEVAQRGRVAGAKVERHLGAFFLSMQAYHVVPAFFVGAVAAVDALLSRLMPRLCARSYVLFRKEGGRDGEPRTPNPQPR
jgi:ubiquinone/menaquinone biosynthesis C-methylase UbiE